jgi:hypothetical protein
MPAIKSEAIALSLAFLRSMRGQFVLDPVQAASGQIDEGRHDPMPAAS